jgi:high-affinity Fe2+/Pb2+ permease
MMSAMNFLNSPRKLFWVGVVCVVLGFVLPFLIILGFIDNTFALTFFIYTLQLVGMILGVMAGAGLAVEKRQKEINKRKSTEPDERESRTGWME